MRHPALLAPAFSPLTKEQSEQFRTVVAAALAEDGASADVTSAATIQDGVVAVANMVFRRGGVVAGIPIAALAFSIVDPKIRFEAIVTDGDLVPPNAVLAKITGPARSVLAGERVALNFVGLLSGIATFTRAFVDAVRDFPVRICDTRKTTPGLRALERYAVRAGGGYNHRFNLSDALLIKDNHVLAVGSVDKAVAAARANAKGDLILEVECDSVEQVREAVKAGVDAVLLDNMTPQNIRAAVAIARGHAAIEASGGITLENVRDVAKTGVDVISVGALTHSAPTVDVALDFTAPETSKTESQREDWVNAHMGRTSKETAQRLLTTQQPRPPEHAPILHLQAVKARCVAGGASNFWIIGSEAGEPTLNGDYPLIGISPTAYFVQAAEYNFLPYAIQRSRLAPDNHSISGDTKELEARMHEVYG
ncbi:MAG TPA: carboxylating nicotinate-nucleotide diphosphorylase [Candidatus Eremiobacteraceae bacterium]|nr:carboxylating nicotinate-nucleotide diphosphorylase [Candidatus Eremiobacteraceae bacterium]